MRLTEAGECLLPGARALVELAERAPDEEGLVVAELDLGLISLAKAAADPAGHYARPDVTRLLLTERAPRPVESVMLEGPEPVTATDDLVAPAAPEPTLAAADG